MKTNTVVLDIEGLSSYPGFADQIVKPLEEKGTGVVFWTFAPRDVGYERLRECGLKEYAQPGSCISKENFHQIQSAYRTNGQTIDFIDNDKLQVALVGMGQSLAPDNIQRFTNELRRYESLRFTSIKCKFPPLLNDGNFLLVESDSARYDNETHSFLVDGNLAGADKRLATIGGYSIIIVPEYPDTWDANSTRLTTGDVLGVLRDRVLQWDGKQEIRDIRHETGMYEEWLERFPEVRRFGKEIF